MLTVCVCLAWLPQSLRRLRDSSLEDGACGKSEPQKQLRQINSRLPRDRRERIEGGGTVR